MGLKQDVNPGETKLNPLVSHPESREVPERCGLQKTCYDHSHSTASGRPVTSLRGVCSLPSLFPACNTHSLHLTGIFMTLSVLFSPVTLSEAHCLALNADSEIRVEAPVTP